VQKPPRLRFALLSLALLTACARRETPVELGNRTQTLHQNIGAEPQDLDPHLMQANPHFNVLMALYEGLTGYDPKDLHPVPGVADRWEVSADGLVYTFHLRAEAQWSNGDPVTAHDFEFSVRRILSPKLGSPYAHYFDIVRGAEDFHAGRLKDFTQVGVRALDDRTLRIELRQPAPYLFFLLGGFAWMPVHRATVESRGKFDTPYSGWTRPGVLVSNGPFVLNEWRNGDAIVVKKNPRYWDARTVRLQEIHFHLIENADTEERAFRSGLLHLTEFVPASKLATYGESAPEQLQVTPFFSTYLYEFNLARPPFNDPRVRRAFSLAIDRAQLAASQPQQRLLPAIGLVPPGTDDYRFAGPHALRFDPAEARRLLAEANYPGGKGFPAVDLHFDTSARHQLFAEVLQQMWQRHLGVRVNLVNVEGRVFHAERVARKYALTRGGWVGDYLDPHAFLSVHLTGGGQNVAGYANPEFDRLARAALDQLDRPARHALYRQAEDALLRDMPILPLFHYTSTHLVSPAVRGRYPNLLDYHPYQSMWLEAK
jgi:oligopeptide transport system substrate-binding protein